MKVQPTEFAGLVVLFPDRYEDDRGWFIEAWNRRDFADLVGEDAEFVQDNHSHSVQGVLRGLHYQLPNPQAKLVRCVSGTVWDVAVDLRRSSDTFGRSCGLELSEHGQAMLWIPEGFAHGFLALSESADLVYKSTGFHTPEAEQTIRWNDEQLAIDWPLVGDPIVSERDKSGLAFEAAPHFD